MNSTRIFAVIAMTLCTIASGCQKDENKADARHAPPPAPAGTIVAVGDSLTAGYGLPQGEAYPALMQKKLESSGYHWKVVNAGISGETSSGTLSRIDWIMKLKPDIVVLETGANDGLRGIDPALTQQNIEVIVRRLKEKDVEVVLAGMKALRNMGAPFGTRFAGIYPTVAKKHDLILVPFFLDGVAGEANLNQQDGIHPTTEGYRIVTDTIYPYLVQAIERKKRNG